MDSPVIIVGAGPTGTLCSIHLSKKGIEHILIEASSFPRDKACADILTSKAIRELQAVGHGLWEKIKELPSYNPIWGTKLKVENQDFLEIPYRALNENGLEPSCVAVKRMELDVLLWDLARSLKTCKAFEEQRVSSYNSEGNRFSIKTAGNKWSCRNLILANGCSGALSQSTKIQDFERHTAIGVRAYYEEVNMLDEDRCELYLQRQTMPGGFYIAPLGNGIFNVNMVIRKDVLKRKKFNLTELMTDFTQSNPFLKVRFQGARRISKVIGHPLSLGTVDRTRYVNGVFLAGDAGGLIDLISANGIPQGLLSGRLAAEAIEKISYGESTEDEAGSFYDSELRKQTSADLKVGRNLSPLMSYDWFNTVLLASIQRIQNSDENNFLQDILYSDNPWGLIKKKVNPLARRQV